MSDKSSIEWTDASWNPLRGQNARHTCARISPGCDNCYAATMTRRGLGGTAAIDYGRGETPNDPSRLDEKALMQPHRWKEPRRIFVCSMTDIAGSWVQCEWFHAMWTVMAETPRHTYQVLTKRPSRLKQLIEWFQEDAHGFGPYPLPNVWIGTSIESDAYTWRGNVLRAIPAAARWISAEPLLGPLDSLDLAGIDWLVAGGESGPGARPMHPDWARDLRDRCQASGTAFHFKQWGAWLPGQNDPHPAQSWGIVHWQDGVWKPRQPKLPEAYVTWNADGEMRTGFRPPTPVAAFAIRVGKKAAGRLLDGRTWDDYPTVAARP